MSTVAQSLHYYFCFCVFKFLQSTVIFGIFPYFRLKSLRALTCLALLSPLFDNGGKRVVVRSHTIMLKSFLQRRRVDGKF